MQSSHIRPAGGAFFAIIGILAIVFSFAAPTAASGHSFDITLHGENEVPPVFTDATGGATVQLQADGLHYTLNATGSTFTMAHIHLGAAGTNGPVVAWLFQDDDGAATVDAAGLITEADLVGPLEGDWDGLLEALGAGELYINVHSEAYPAGELRAQIYPRWGATLSADEETAEVDSDGTGSFFMTTGADSAGYTLEGSGGTGAYTMAHIHIAPPGEDGPIVAWLFDATAEPVAAFDVDGTLSVADIEGPIEGDWGAFLSELGGGTLYVNVHSEAYPAGEVRGQIAHVGNVDAEPPDVDEPTPTPTPTEETPTPTPTVEAPDPPDTGTGTERGGTPAMLAGVLGAAALAIGAGLLPGMRRRAG